MIPLLMMPVFAAAGNKVLLWNANASSVSGSAGRTLECGPVYTDMGLTVHNSSTWSGTLSDYKLIIWLTPASNPSWWGQITGNTWSGRLVMCAEYYQSPTLTFYDDTCDYIDGITSMTGITLVRDVLDVVPGPSCASGTVTGDALMSGQSSLAYAATSQVSGGTTLATTVTGSHPFIARNKPSGSNIEFVVAGDSNIFHDAACTAISVNTPFLENLYNVAV